jgi:hypothetical protein
MWRELKQQIGRTENVERDQRTEKPSEIVAA